MLALITHKGFSLKIFKNRFEEDEQRDNYAIDC